MYSNQLNYQTFCPWYRTQKPLETEGLFYLAVWTGLEPATPCVTGMYSNQLNYQTFCQKIPHKTVCFQRCKYTIISYNCKFLVIKNYFFSGLLKHLIYLLPFKKESLQDCLFIFLQQLAYFICISLFWCYFNLASNYFSVLENQNCWNVSNTVLRSKILIGIYIYFSYHNLTFKVSR